MTDTPATPQRKLRLGDLLVQAGLISDNQLQMALLEQKRSGAKLGRAVVDMGFISEQKLLEALSRQLNIPYVDLRQFKFNEALVQRLPEALARRFRAILLVPEGEANLKEGKIAATSPIAQGIMGKKVGDIVQVKVPAGVIPFEIVEISI